MGCGNLSEQMEVLLCENVNKNDISLSQIHSQLFKMKLAVTVPLSVFNRHTDQRKSQAQMTSQTFKQEIVPILHNLF